MKEFIKKRLKEELDMNKVAVIEITIPLAHISSDKYYYQAVPYWKTLANRIFVTKGNGSASLSTKNIKILKTFDYTQKDEIEQYLNQLRNSN